MSTQTKSKPKPKQPKILYPVNSKNRKLSRAAIRSAWKKILGSDDSAK